MDSPSRRAAGGVSTNEPFVEGSPPYEGIVDFLDSATCRRSGGLFCPSPALPAGEGVGEGTSSWMLALRRGFLSQSVSATPGDLISGWMDAGHNNPVYRHSLGKEGVHCPNRLARRGWVSQTSGCRRASVFRSALPDRSNRLLESRRGASRLPTADTPCDPTLRWRCPRDQSLRARSPAR
jgi:hypothetical protein